MWHALRAELAYSRPWLLGGLGLAVGVSVLITVIFYAVGDQGPPLHAAAGIRGMFLIMAPLIVGFIIHTFRSEERRARLLLAGPLTPRRLAAVTVLLPIFLFGIGVVGALSMLGVETLVTGTFAFESLHIVGYVGGLILMMQMIGLVAQEAVAAHQQRRSGAAVAGWTGFGLAVVFLTGLSAAATFLQKWWTWPILHAANLTVVILAIPAVIALYSSRTDFTK